MSSAVNAQNERVLTYPGSAIERMQTYHTTEKKFNDLIQFFIVNFSASFNLQNSTNQVARFISRIRGVSKFFRKLVGKAARR